MDIEDMDMNNSQQKLYKRLEENREHFRGRDLTKRRKKRHSMTASTRKRNLKHSYLMSRRSQPSLSKKQRKTKQSAMDIDAPPSRKSSRAKKETEKYNPAEEAERQKQLQTDKKENEVKKYASRLVQSLGYSDNRKSNVPVKILNTDLFNKALSQAVEDDLFGESQAAYDSDELGYYSDNSMGRRKKKNRGGRKRGTKKYK
jgi:hypothetical protein